MQRENKTFDLRWSEWYHFRQINFDGGRCATGGNPSRRNWDSTRNVKPRRFLDVLATSRDYAVVYAKRGKKRAPLRLCVSRADQSTERKHHTITTATSIVIVERLSLGKLSARLEREAAVALKLPSFAHVTSRPPSEGVHSSSTFPRVETKSLLKVSAQPSLPRKLYPNPRLDVFGITFLRCSVRISSYRAFISHDAILEIHSTDSLDPNVTINSVNCSKWFMSHRAINETVIRSQHAYCEVNRRANDTCSISAGKFFLLYMKKFKLDRVERAEEQI